MCLCRGVSDSEVKRVIADGASSVPEVMRACGAGTRCGTCRPTIAAMIEGREPQASSRRCLRVLPEAEAPSSAA